MKLKYNLLFVGVLVLVVGSLYAKSLNSFDVSNSIINTSKILSGGPAKDGIPSIDHPRFIKVGKVDFLKDNDMVMGIIRDGIQKAYPTRILIWHEIVNDKINDEYIVVTYCPLCGTGMVFDRKIDGSVYTFGVSGLLYNSDVLMFDRQTNSLWSQLLMLSTSGQNVNKKLRWLNSSQMTWKAWRSKYPKSLVLSKDTGYDSDYSSSAYSGYFSSDKPMFAVDKNRDEIRQKQWVLGIKIDGIAKAYSMKDLQKYSPIKDTFQGKHLAITYDKDTKETKVYDDKDNDISSVRVFWFAWQAFYPKTKLWRKNNKQAN